MRARLRLGWRRARATSECAFRFLPRARVKRALRTLGRVSRAAAGECHHRRQPRALRAAIIAKARPRTNSKPVAPPPPPEPARACTFTVRVAGVAGLPDESFTL